MSFTQLLNPPANIAVMATEKTGARREGRAQRRDAAANRARILDVAAATVKREGFRVPMATIAQDAGVGIGTVYRHFPNRDHLMVGLAERSFEFVLDNARAAASSAGSPSDAIGAFFEMTIRDRNEFVLPWHGGPTVSSERTKALRSKIWRLIGGVVRRGVADGSIRHGVTAADVIMFGAMLAQPLPHSSDWDRVARRQARVYLSGLGAVEADPLSGRPLSIRRRRR